MTLKEKSAYIKGLMDGMNFSPDSDEKKLIVAITDFLSDVADKISEIEEDNEYISEYVEELDEDLGDLEEFVYDEEDYDDDEDYDEVCDVECDCGNLIEVSCENIKDGKLVCPVCGKEFDLEEICGDCEDCTGCC